MPSVPIRVHAGIVDALRTEIKEEGALGHLAFATPGEAIAHFTRAAIEDARRTSDAGSSRVVLEMDDFFIARLQALCYHVRNNPSENPEAKLVEAGRLLRMLVDSMKATVQVGGRTA